ncbi:unnamed protein product [Camellia sinensis]
MRREPPSHQANRISSSSSYACCGGGKAFSAGSFRQPLLDRRRIAARARQRHGLTSASWANLCVELSGTPASSLFSVATMSSAAAILRWTFSLVTIYFGVRYPYDLPVYVCLYFFSFEFDGYQAVMNLLIFNSSDLFGLLKT